ncbi:HlyD family type I secretion periplasmic adaptor subunit [Qipengyuania sp. G39]|uniref:Membrane fusion protein (MFP) family protein n=1 Tax=Qipengyuania profundimaris TaxID=3067652 RepID=A0ABT9HM44_9SPHN|nr:HlyD family type I secretion periplasmic adaptor subunit [Qipengyuania sp. G39]MDP4574186.1 HlyD family type I secretion periplasmic adaptor subunit [Qipengyuania sp. G39]
MSAREDPVDETTEGQPQHQPMPGQMPEREEGRVERFIDNLEPRRVSRWLFWAIVVFFVVFLIWAALAEIDRTVRGQGRVISSNELQIVSSLEGGVLEEIFVTTGQQVEALDPVLRLDPTETGSNLGSTSATAGALEMKVARLEAELAGRAPSFPAPADEEAARQRSIESALYASRQANLQSSLAGARAQLARARQQVTEAERQSDSLASQAQAARAEADLLRPLVDQGIEPRLSLVRAEGQATSAEAQLAGARASIGRAQAQVYEAQANLDRTLRDWRAQSANELAAAQAELGARSATLPALEERLARTTLRSPVTGTVNRVLVNTRGSAVSPGEPLVEITATDDALLVEVRIRPQDIGTVRIGQDAKVGITAFDQTIYGSLDGKVVTISPDSIVDERSGEIFYLVRVRTEMDSIPNVDGDLEIGTGMVADVSLLGDKRTVLQYILTPLRRFSDRAFRE